MESDDRPTTVQSIAGVGQALITSLPPAFLALVAINVVFVITTVWFMDHQRADRTVMFTRMMDACVAQIERSSSH